MSAEMQQERLGWRGMKGELEAFLDHLGSRKIDARERSRVLPGRLSTSFVDLDQLTGGLAPGDLWVITGRFCSGKSTLLLDLIRSCLDAEREAVLVQRTGSPADVVARLLSARARVAIDRIRHRELDSAEFARLARAMGTLANGPELHVCEVDTGLPADLTPAIAALSRRGTVGLVAVDHLETPVSSLALTELAQIARRDGVAVVAAVNGDQLAAIEQSVGGAGDVVIRVDRDFEICAEPGDDVSPRLGEADFHVRRNRRGPRMTLTVAFQGHYARFVDIAAV